jgi:hypothetical protein
MASTSRLVAMKERHVKIAVVAAKVKKPYVMFENGVIAHITGWLDEDHFYTDDPDEYTYFEFDLVGEDGACGTAEYSEYTMESYLDH